MLLVILALVAYTVFVHVDAIDGDILMLDRAIVSIHALHVAARERLYDAFLHAFRKGFLLGWRERVDLVCIEMYRAEAEGREASGVLRLVDIPELLDNEALCICWRQVLRLRTRLHWQINLHLSDVALDDIMLDWYRCLAHAATASGENEAKDDGEDGWYLSCHDATLLW